MKRFYLVFRMNKILNENNKKPEKLPVFRNFNLNNIICEWGGLCL